MKQKSRTNRPGKPAQAAGVIAGLALCFSLNASAQTPEDQKLDSFFRHYLDEEFEQQPLQATALGDHRFDQRLDDISATARGRWLALTKTTLRQLPRAVKYRDLSRDGQIDYDIFRHNLETDIWETKNFHPFEDDPRTYGAYLDDSVYLLLTQSTLPAETNIANCIARMAQFPRIIAEAEKTLAHPPQPILETAIRQNRGAIDFYQKDIFQYAGDTAQREQLKASAAATAVLLEGYQQFLEGPLRARATGEWRIGKRRFDKKFELETDAGVTAEQNRADAQEEFDRVRRDMFVIARQLWCQYFPDKPMPPDDALGERETILKVIDAIDQDHDRADELVPAARAAVERIKDFIRRRNYLPLPEPDQCQVIVMPEFRRGNSLAYLDNAPPLDPRAHSYYAVSPPPADWTPQEVETFLQEYNRYMLQILTIHEGYPGHYVQLAYANRTPSLIRRVYQSGSYVEGWAVYGEMTMLNEGYGNGDLRLRLMELKFYLRAVANSILDYQMHCTGMTDAEAMKFLTQDAFQSEGEAKLKLIRAKQSSVQLSTYFVGRMAHYRLHQEVEREMGDRFNLSDYHRAVISHGSIPPKYLPELVRRDLGLTP
ncbi:MAG TPA: DUF885 domain-containing protein [Verrucomicrobiae bacterium]|nr:DUF885 domain-containing protein [Verrucomicrobiae bacterium]